LVKRRSHPLREGWTEIETGWRSHFDNREYEELNQQGCVERQPLNISANQSDPESIEHHTPMLPWCAWQSFALGKKTSAKLIRFEMTWHPIACAPRRPRRAKPR
jgi:hypothetical protein